MGFIEDALSLCALLCSIEMSELPRPRGRRRSSDSDEAETVCNNEGGEDYAPRECPRAASLPLAFIEQGLAFAYPSAPNRRRRFLWTRLFKGSSSASLRAPRTHQIARRGGAWRCLTTLGSSMPPANGTPTAFPRHVPSIASFANTLQKMMPRGGEAPYMGRFLSSGGEPASDADDSFDVSGSFEDTDFDWSDTSDASGEEGYLYEEEEEGAEFDSDSDSFSWVHAD